MSRNRVPVTLLALVLVATFPNPCSGQPPRIGQALDVSVVELFNNSLPCCTDLTGCLGVVATWGNEKYLFTNHNARKLLMAHPESGTVQLVGIPDVKPIQVALGDEGRQEIYLTGGAHPGMYRKNFGDGQITTILSSSDFNRPSGIARWFNQTSGRWCLLVSSQNIALVASIDEDTLAFTGWEMPIKADAIAVSPDGTHLATMQRTQGTVRVVDIYAQQITQSPRNYNAQLRDITWSADGRWLAVAGSNVYFVSTDTFDRHEASPPLAGNAIHSLGSSGRFLIGSSADGLAVVDVPALASIDSQIVLSASLNGAKGVTATWGNQPDAYLICDVNTEAINSVDPVSGDITVLASSADSGWPSGSKPQHIVMGDQAQGTAYFTTVSPAAVMKLDVRTGSVSTHISLAQEAQGVVRYFDSTANEWCLIVTNAGTPTALVSYWEASGLSTGWWFAWSSFDVLQGLALSSDSTQLAVADSGDNTLGGSVFVVNMETKQVTHQVQVANASAVAFSADSSWIIVNGAELRFISTANWLVHIGLTDWSAMPAGGGGQGVSAVGSSGKLLVTNSTAGLTVLALDESDFSLCSVLDIAGAVSVDFPIARLPEIDDFNSTFVANATTVLLDQCLQNLTPSGRVNLQCVGGSWLATNADFQCVNPILIALVAQLNQSLLNMTAVVRVNAAKIVALEQEIANSEQNGALAVAQLPSLETQVAPTKEQAPVPKSRGTLWLNHHSKPGVRFGDESSDTAIFQSGQDLVFQATDSIIAQANVDVSGTLSVQGIDVLSALQNVTQAIEQLSQNVTQ